MTFNDAFKNSFENIRPTVDLKSITKDAMKAEFRILSEGAAAASQVVKALALKKFIAVAAALAVFVAGSTAGGLVFTSEDFFSGNSFFGKFFSNDDSLTDQEKGLSAALTSSPADGSTLAEGNEVTYTVTVTNNGEGTVENIGISAQIPDGTIYKSGDTSSTIESLAPGQSAAISFSVSVSSLPAGINRRTTQNLS